MLKLENVSKIYVVNDKPFYALNNVSLEIGDGEMVAVRGRSGAGKSTLLHILGALDTFERGDYWLDDVHVNGLSSRQLAKIRNEKIGFVLQDFSLINHKTALYNVKAPMLFNDVPFGQMKPRAMQALREMHMEPQAKKDVVNMSGGQRQRVAIARAIVNDTPIILADEPTGNLDSSTAAEIMEIFTKLNKEGKTVVIVTHDDAVASYCHRTITISDGKIVE